MVVKEVTGTRGRHKETWIEAVKKEKVLASVTQEMTLNS